LVALGCVPYVLDEYAGAIYSIKVSGALAGPEGLPGPLTTLDNLTLRMCTAACSFDMLAVQPASTLSQHGYSYHQCSTAPGTLNQN